MSLNQMKEFLAESLDDVRLSRSERTVLQQLHDEWQPSQREQQLILHHAFELVKAHQVDVRDKQVIDWLEEVVKTLRPANTADSVETVTCFFPEDGEEGLGRLLSAIRHCRRQLDICVFTITYNKIADEVVAAFKRGVTVRIISDDEKSIDLGSDIERFERSGIPVRFDNSPAHMHHKFAVFDQSAVLTGSFNWTKSAAKHNKEDFTITNDSSLVQHYRQRFEQLWAQFAPPASASARP